MPDERDIPVSDFCRYCGQPTTRDDLECDECFLQWVEPTAADDLPRQVARWSIRIEGLTHFGHRRIEDTDIQGDRL